MGQAGQTDQVLVPPTGKGRRSQALLGEEVPRQNATTYASDASGANARAKSGVAKVSENEDRCILGLDAERRAMTGRSRDG